MCLFVVYIVTKIVGEGSDVSLLDNRGRTTCSGYCHAAASDGD
jgi:hypothetical protein